MRPELAVRTQGYQILSVNEEHSLYMADGLLASQNGGGGNLSIESGEEDTENTLTIISTFKMYAVSPFDSYPVTDGTLYVEYRHRRIAYSQLNYKGSSFAKKEDAILVDINKNAYIKVDELSSGSTEFFSYGSNNIYTYDDAYKNINSHIEEVKAKAIEAIPEAKEATNIVVKHGARGSIGVLGPYANH